MPVPAHKTRRMFSLDRSLSAHLDRWAAAAKTHHGRIVESALRTYWESHAMTRIIYWTYEADSHCLECSEKRFGPSLPEQSDNFVDSEGNPPHPVFSTGEHLQEGDDCHLPVACGTCSTNIIEHPASEFSAPDVVADGSGGNYSNWEYADAIVSYLNQPFEIPARVQKSLQDPDWGNEELESVISRANDWLARGTGRHCLTWSDCDPGCLLLAPTETEESDSLL